MTAEDVSRILDELREWCHGKHGRQKALADAIGVKKQIVYNWLNAKSVPSWAHGLDIQDFLRRQRKKHSGPVDE